MRHVILLCFIVSLCAISHPVFCASIASAPLQQAEARERAARVGDVRYALNLNLSPTMPEFRGTLHLRFSLSSSDTPLTLDYNGQIDALDVNGTTVTPESTPRGLRLPAAALVNGDNTVQLRFTSRYSRNSAGLHYFRDPEDGEVYLYSNLQPFDAHRVFPCFDQPDIKGRLTLTVTAPRAWEVIGNMPGTATAHQNGQRRWQFPETPPLSPYIMAVHAGPYTQWTADANGIPLRLMARRSIARHVDAQEWLTLTQRGLAWFEDYFGHRYPFTKYDQLIVPEFLSGAMENAAAVTYAERHVFRSPVTEDRRRRRANTILHEMAHMWFGNLVTLAWWDGLWLNESFANYVAARAVEDVTPYRGMWQHFLSAAKRWGYTEDLRVTTHPVEVPVKDTDEAETVFDGITYGKGAGLIKQLVFTVGESKFRDALALYFRRHAWDNTETEDLFAALSDVSDHDLSAWRMEWLQTTGTNVITWRHACRKDTLAHVEIHQHAPTVGDTRLRTHHTRLGMLQREGERWINGTHHDIVIRGALTRWTPPTPVPCPAWVHPNQDDHAFVTLKLSPADIDLLSVSLSRIEDSLTRQMLWQSLWYMVIRGELEAGRYAAIVFAHAGEERHTQVLQRLLATLADPNADDFTVPYFTAAEQQPRLRYHIEAFMFAGFRRAPAGSDLQRVWFRGITDALVSEAGQRQALDWLEQRHTPPGLRLEQDRRWDLLLALARNGHPDARALLQAERGRDPGDLGRKRAIAIEASLPDPKTKALWMQRISQRELPFTQLRSAMMVYQVSGQTALTQSSVDTYFSSVPGIHRHGDAPFARRFVSWMYPPLCNEDVIRRTRQILDQPEALPAYTRKALQIRLQEMQQCMAARQVANTGPAL